MYPGVYFQAKSFETWWNVAKFAGEIAVGEDGSLLLFYVLFGEQK